MSEEKRNPGAEISEAKLAGVSGGTICKDEFEKRAYDICCGCGWNGNHCSGQNYHSLGAYLRENGIDSVNKGNRTKCPYYIP